MSTLSSLFCHLSIHLSEEVNHMCYQQVRVFFPYLLFHWVVRKEYVIKQYLVLHCTLCFPRAKFFKTKAGPFAHVILVFEAKKSSVIFDLI